MEEKDFDRCVERIRSGDKEALHDIYKAYSGFIYHLILQVVGTRENAEDVTSEFFIRLWKIAERYKPGNGHRTWLATIARNMAIDYVRTHKRELPFDQSEVLFEDQADDSISVENQVVADMSVKQALETLKPAEREIVHLKIYGDMTFAQIAKMLEVPIGTVTWRYDQAVKRLRRCGYEA